jgi:hypothetical protein
MNLAAEMFNGVLEVNTAGKASIACTPSSRFRYRNITSSY